LIINHSSNPLKDKAYRDLVNKRKSCQLCTKLKNPSTFLKYDSNEIGSWSLWQGGLDADILLVGQDWGGVDYFLKHYGMDEDRNDTNKHLVTLFNSIGLFIEGPESPIKNDKLFFTNVILCLKSGGLTTPVEQKYAQICCEQYLKSLISIIHPKVVIALGTFAFESIVQCYNLNCPPLKDAINVENGFTLESGIRLFPVHHCGYWGWNKNRKDPMQIQDWKKIGDYLISITND